MSCPEKSCVGCKVDKKGNRYVSSNCGCHVRPKEITVGNITVGNEQRSLSFYCYDTLADRLVKVFKQNEKEFYFRIQRTLKNINGVSFNSIILIESCFKLYSLFVF